MRLLYYPKESRNVGIITELMGMKTCSASIVDM